MPRRFSYVTTVAYAYMGTPHQPLLIAYSLWPSMSEACTAVLSDDAIRTAGDDAGDVADGACDTSTMLRIYRSLY